MRPTRLRLRCAMHIIAAALCSKQWDKGRMIGKLKGIIDSYGEDFIVLDVNGVGYLVQCSARTLQELPGAGQPAALAIETHVREDQIRLFGFLTDVEREWFRLLQTVQGVGAKVALSVLSTLKPADLASAIALRDKAMVARAPGVGPKVAERIVTDWKEVGAAFRTRDGRIYTGVNLDAYLGRMAVCAEAVALGRAITENGETGIDTIVAVRHPEPSEPDQTITVVSPCGSCRELIWDYDRNARVIVPTGNGPALAAIAE